MTLMNTLRGISVVLLAGASIASAQQYPTKPIRFILPALPGGGFDLVGRTISPKISESLGRQVVVENRGGAQGNAGTALGAKAAPDGYTVVLTYIGALAIAPWMYKDLGYHPLRDFEHITQLSSSPYLVVTHPSVPAKSLKELAAFAKAHPDQLTFASSGTANQLAGELFKIMTGTRMTHIPYKGSSGAAIDLLGGHIALSFLSPAATTGHVKSGRLRGLAVTGTSRLPALPDVPTSREAGYPGLDVKGWYGVSAPANTPKEIVARLNAEFVRALRLPEVKERLNSVGFDTVGDSSEEFTAYVKSEYERWGEVVKKSGVTAD
ncbi:MAG: tripartite tricarboxylate transporter substrate binding protein [Betaproteobacteria bacterium]|nr:tripartite tricarboxylate transporter substrate binding protein [Betaproteobacteria bacterium]